MVKLFSIGFFVLLLFAAQDGMAQKPSAFTLKYFGLTIHPFGDKTADLQPYKLDSRAHFVANFGVFLGYERFFYKDYLSLKFIQGIFTDCSGGFAGISHLGIRTQMFRFGKHRFYFGIGPTFLYRHSWSRFGEAYSSSGYFKETTVGKMETQYKLIPYGMEIEWDYYPTEKDAISLSFTPGVPMAVIFSLGWKHWISMPDFDHHRLYVPKR